MHWLGITLLFAVPNAWTYILFVMNVCACLDETYGQRVTVVKLLCTAHFKALLIFLVHCIVCVRQCAAFPFSRNGEEKQCNSCKKTACSLAVSIWGYFYILSRLHKNSVMHIFIIIRKIRWSFVSIGKIYMLTEYLQKKQSWKRELNSEYQHSKSFKINSNGNW